MPDINADRIARTLDGLTLRRMHLVTAFVLSLGLFVDIAELSLNAVFSTGFPDAMAFVPVEWRSLLLGSVFAGGIIGAPLFGLIADRLGRRTALGLSMLMVTILSASAALAPSVEGLVLCRFLSGLALGAYPPLMTAWLTDILPPKWRARVILWADAAGFLGAPGLVFLVLHLESARPEPVDGLDPWRSALFICAGAALLCALGLALLPDSPRWLATRGRIEAARRALARFDVTAPGMDVSPGGLTPALRPTAGQQDPYRPPDAVAKGAFRQRVAVIFALYALRAVPTVVFPVLMGLALREKGLDFKTSLFVVATTSFGGLLGTLCASIVVDRTERRRALHICGTLLIACGTLFAATSSAPLLIASAGAFLTLGAIFGPILSIYAAEIMPTTVRASTTATAWGLTRLVSSSLPIVLLPLLMHAQTWAFMAVVLGSIALSMAILFLFGPAQAPTRAIV